MMILARCSMLFPLRFLGKLESTTPLGGCIRVAGVNDTVPHPYSSDRCTAWLSIDCQVLYACDYAAGRLRFDHRAMGLVGAKV